MHNNQTQSRPKREAAHSKELSDLKKENHSLKRTVKRLQKEITKRTSVEEDAVDEAPEESASTVEAVSLCCGVPIKSITLNSKTWVVCPECKARRKIE